jgi:hypothetical protein
VTRLAKPRHPSRYGQAISPAHLICPAGLPGRVWRLRLRLCDQGDQRFGDEARLVHPRRERVPLDITAYRVLRKFGNPTLNFVVELIAPAVIRQRRIGATRITSPHLQPNL